MSVAPNLVATILVISHTPAGRDARMHHAYWAKSQSQTLLPTALEAPAAPRRWRLGAAIASCAVIFLIDLALPGVVVGLLYSLVVVGLSRAGHGSWLAAVCALGTLLHAV